MAPNWCRPPEVLQDVDLLNLLRGGSICNGTWRLEKKACLLSAIRARRLAHDSLVFSKFISTQK